MVSSRAKTVAAYMAQLEPERRAALAKLRALIRKTRPDVKESMFCGMPCYGTACAFASQKHYMALYVDVQVMKAHRKDLGKLDCGKCCIRFKRFEDLPLAVVTKMIKAKRAGSA